MKKTLNEIRLKISKVATSLREDAIVSGAMSDYGACELERKLEMFSLGIKAATDAYIEEYNKVLPSDTLYEVPKMWHKYFLEDEVEYQEYLRLKEKFKNI